MPEKIDQSTRYLAGQIELLTTNGYGTNDLTAAKLPGSEWSVINPGDPSNCARMLAGSIAWYAQNATSARQQLIGAPST